MKQKLSLPLEPQESAISHSEVVGFLNSSGLTLDHLVNMAVDYHYRSLFDEEGKLIQGTNHRCLNFDRTKLLELFGESGDDFDPLACSSYTGQAVTIEVELDQSSIEKLKTIFPSSDIDLDLEISRLLWVYVIRRNNPI